MGKARLERGPEDGEFDERHGSQGPGGGGGLEKRRKYNGLGRGKGRESLISRNGKQTTITSAEVQGLTSVSM